MQGWAREAGHSTTNVAGVDVSKRELAVAIGGIANGLNPDVIVITGGIVKSLARYEDRILEHAAEYGFAATLADARIHFVPGYKNQTVRGGAALVLYERSRRADHPPMTKFLVQHDIPAEG